MIEGKWPLVCSGIRSEPHMSLNEPKCRTFLWEETTLLGISYHSSSPDASSVRMGRLLPSRTRTFAGSSQYHKEVR